MYQHTRLNSDQNFFQKIKNLDFILLFCILILSALSGLIMYSTDGGEFLYHTKSHLIKLVGFFILMLVIAFLNINFGIYVLIFYMELLFYCLFGFRYME